LISTLFGSLAGFFAVGMPIAFSLGIAALIGIVVQDAVPVTIIVQRLYEGTDSFPLLAVPLFLLAGSLMDTGGISPRLIKFACTLVGQTFGGLGIASVLASMIFAGISGAAVADAVAIGVIMIPAMMKRGYSQDFVVGIQSAASSIGVVIPPSIPMVIFGVVGGVSIGKLFLGGVVPGIMMGGILMVTTYYTARKNNWPREPKCSSADVWVTLKDASWALLMPIIIMGGIITGVCTPTEAAVVAVLYGMFVGFFIYKDLKMRDIPGIFTDAAVTTAAVMLVIASASLFAWVLTSFQVPKLVVGFMTSLVDSQGMLLLLVNILLLFVGTFLDTGSAIIILAPILIPLAEAFKVDIIHFGVMVVVNLSIGMLTPPYGVTLFACSSIAKLPIEKSFKALIPIWAAMLVVLALITIFPELVLYIPNLFIK